MNYLKLIGFGVVIWIAAYMTATAFVAYGAGDTGVAGVTTAIIVAVVTFVLARNLHERSLSRLFFYAIGWVGIGLVLDLLFTIPFTGWELFRTWNIWTGYGLIIVATLLSQEGFMGGRRQTR